MVPEGFLHMIEFEFVLGHAPLLPSPPVPRLISAIFIVPE